MRVITALALLMSLALQWPIQIVLAWLLEEDPNSEGDTHA